MRTLWEGELLGAGVHYEDQGVMRTVALAPSGRRAFFGGGGHTGGSGSDGFFLVDLEEGTHLELLESPPTACISATFSADEHELLALTHSSLYVFDLASGRHRCLAMPGQREIAGVDDAALVWTTPRTLLVATGGLLVEVDLETDRADVIPSDASRFSRVAGPLPAGGALVTTQTGGSARTLWRVNGRTLTKLWTTAHEIAWVAPAANQAFLIAHDDEGEARFLRRRLDTNKTTKIALPEELAEELEGNLNPYVIAMSSDARQMLLSRDQDDIGEVFLLRVPPTKR
ncbi:MAG: hypothetical protein JNL21_30610 [Myxococcales bacterium]|nr:hypothetical protein [Myxococcales bacterium]